MPYRWRLKLGASRRNPIRGDSLRLTVGPIRSVPQGSGGLQKAWLTFKASIDDEDEDAILQKTIGTIATISGHILDTGDQTGQASLYFDLAYAEMILFSSGRSVPFDVQVKTADGQIFTPLLAEVTFDEQVTRATE